MNSKIIIFYKKIKNIIYRNIFFSNLASLILPAAILFNNNFELLTLQDLNIVFFFLLIVHFLIFGISMFSIFKEIEIEKMISFLLIANLLSNYFIFKNNYIKFEIFIFINLIFITFYLFFLFKKKMLVNRTIKFINISIYIFCLISILKYSSLNLDKKEIKFVNNYFLNLNLKQKPDIYHIIPDGLVGISTAKKYDLYNDDNFSDTLKNNGLISLKSYSNYPTTFASIPSILNGSVFTSDTNVKEKKFYKLNNNSSFINMLKKNGYDVIWFENDWIGTKCRDKNFICPQKYHLDEIFNNEVIREYLKIININYDWHEKILKLLKIKKLYYLDNVKQQLEKINYDKSTRPKYIFSHILTPHPPYKVNKNCEPIYTTGESPVWDNTKYFKEYECFKKQLLEFHRFIKNKKRPYILIVSSDTGWTFDDKLHPSTNTSLMQWPTEQFKNFIVINKEALCFDVEKKITNAQILPYIISCINQKKLPIIDNRIFDAFYENTDHPLSDKFIFREIN